MKYFNSLLIFWALVYAVGAFGNADFNLSSWGDFSRGMLGFVLLVGSCIYAVIFFITYDDEKEIPLDDLNDQVL